MRLIIHHAYNVKGGVERVTVSLVREFAKLIDRVIFVLPDSTTGHFKELLPPSEKLIYEPLAWPADLASKIKKRIYKDKLRYLVKKHKATHCLYPIINGQKPPDLKIPAFGILHDLYWRFLEHITKEHKKKREGELREWAQEGELIFTVSETTRKEAISGLPGYAHKFKAVPLALDMPDAPAPEAGSTNKSGGIVFYYPSAHFSKQKNHIALFKAVLELAKKNACFKVIISGEDTEKIAGEAILDKPWQEECRVFFHNNISILGKHIELAGFCQRGKVESYYCQASCVVLPSTYEGFGLPLVEALARGLPVIASDLDVFTEQVELYSSSDRVVRFLQRNVEALAQRMEQFIGSPPGRLPEEEVKKRFSHWTWTDVAKAYLNSMEHRAWINHTYQ
jgi:glycosyltransferase involved in cell wall biosynthesis